MVNMVIISYNSVVVVYTSGVAPELSGALGGAVGVTALWLLCKGLIPSSSALVPG